MLQNETIKETVTSDAGEPLVIVNLSYPTLPKKKIPFQKDPLRAHFVPFYRRAAEGFLDFARKELAQKAKKNPEGTPPCGAVLRWTLQNDTDETLCISVEGSVFDGTDTFAITKDERIWDKKTGLLMQNQKST